MGKASVSSHLRLAIEPSHLSNNSSLLQAARYSNILAPLSVKIELIRRPASGKWTQDSTSASRIQAVTRFACPGYPISRAAAGVPCDSIEFTSTPNAFEVTSKRRKGYPSETRVKRGSRVVG